MNALSLFEIRKRLGLGMFDIVEMSKGHLPIYRLRKIEGGIDTIPDEAKELLLLKFNTIIDQRIKELEALKEFVRGVENEKV